MSARAFGRDYLPGAPREYSSKAKNAQEAHEAIRPTDVANTPEKVARYLDDRQRKLYELVWKRAVASQMQSAELDQTTVEIAEPTKETILRATGSVIAFDGFLKLYREDEDDRRRCPRRHHRRPPPRTRNPHPAADAGARPAEARRRRRTPALHPAAAALLRGQPGQEDGGARHRPPLHLCLHPADLQDRNYVKLDKRRFIPEDRGRLVTSFLVKFFERYVDTGFTAGLEEQLDDISGGKLDWRAVMRAFWEEFSSGRRRHQGPQDQRRHRRAG